MAYAGGTATVTTTTISGRRYAILTLSETGAGATSEWSATIPGGWKVATLVSYRATLTAGSGSTIDPVIGRDTAPAAGDQDYIWANGTAAAHVEEPSLDVTFKMDTDGVIYGRSTVDSATDNAISTEIILAEGVGR